MLVMRIVGEGTYPGIEQQIVGLDITMNEAEFVYRIDGQRRLGNVELGAVLGQRVLLHQQRHHVATGQELLFECSKLAQ